MEFSLYLVVLAICYHRHGEVVLNVHDSHSGPLND